MLDSNYRNTSCGYGEDLVAYLYDELGVKEKSKFEAHLTACQSCDKELASFGFIRTSISEWRKEDFAGLSLPSFAIPFEEQVNTVTNISTESNSWLDNLRKIFSPTWATATAGFAVLAICAVITFFAFNYSGQKDLAEENSVKDKPKVEEKVIQPEKEEIVEQKTDEFTQTEKSEPQLVQETPVKKAPIKQVEIKRDKVVVKNSKKQPKSKNTVKDIKKPDDKMVANTNLDTQEIPRLSNFSDESEEDSDDSLRLADLFDEVGDDE